MEIRIERQGDVLVRSHIWFYVELMIFNQQMKYRGKISDLKLFIDGKEIPRPAEMSDDS